MKMQRTTVRIREDIYKKAKKWAVDKNVSFKEVVNKALEKYIKVKKKVYFPPIKLKSKPLNLPLKITRQYIHKD